MTDTRITLEDIIAARRMIEERRDESDSKSYEYGIDFVITQKEGEPEVELPRTSLLIRSLSKLEDLFKEIMKIANKQSQESLKEQKRTLTFRLEWLQESIEEAYCLPSKIELLESLNECINCMDEIQKDADYYEKRYHLYAKKYKEERKKDPNFDEDAHWDELMDEDEEVGEEDED